MHNRVKCIKIHNISSKLELMHNQVKYIKIHNISSKLAPPGYEFISCTQISDQYIKSELHICLHSTGVHGHGGLGALFGYELVVLAIAWSPESAENVMHNHVILRGARV